MTASDQTSTTRTATQESSILSMLHGRAGLRPDGVAFTCTDFGRDPAGVVEQLTWAQLSRRTLNLAARLRDHGAPGDRAVILAPQGLEYVLAFLGSLQAGLVAVPLPLPLPGAGTERVAAVLVDTGPAVVLTTSAAAADVAAAVADAPVDPVVLEVDRLDLDAEPGPLPAAPAAGNLAYLQYSSGSTRTPAGVMLTHRNLTANFDQLTREFFNETPLPPDATLVSWLPFYHDMGLVLGVCAPILLGRRADLMSPLAFLERPARWIRALAVNPHAWSSAPNFAFELAARRTTDDDLEGLDLSGVVGIISGAERVDPKTVRRFVNRFEHVGFRAEMVRPAYGLAEATVFVAAGRWGETDPPGHFDAEELGAGRAVPCRPGRGVALVRYRLPLEPLVRIVDGPTGRECPPDRVGEIWVHGENVSSGYWNKPAEQQGGFTATITDPGPGTPAGPWLRTGDLGFVHDGGLYIVGRSKDVLIIRGRNYFPEDIEATVGEITGGRVAAVAAAADGTEQLVVVAELKASAGGDAERLRELNTRVTAAVSQQHGLNVADLVLVASGSIPTTTSGKIRRAACAEQYRTGAFTRLGA